MCNPAQTQQAVFKEGMTCLLLQNKYNAKRDFPTSRPILDFFPCTVGRQLLSENEYLSPCDMGKKVDLLLI